MNAFKGDFLFSQSNIGNSCRRSVSVTVPAQNIPSLMLDVLEVFYQLSQQLTYEAARS